METEGIDLTKCNNLRYRAVIDGEDDHGRICANGKDVYLRSDVRGLPVVSWDGWGFTGKEVKCFEIVPREPETYRDWQVGDTIKKPDAAYCQGRVIFVSGDFVAIESGGRCTCYTNEELFEDGYRLILTDIEQQIIEERKKYEPQDGDICYAKSTSGFYAIFVYNRCGLDRKTDFYVSFDSRGGLFYSGYAIDTRCLEERRPATDKEKQLLFDAMLKQGKRWNAEKKVVEDIPKPYEFRKGEPVLVRADEFHRWIIAAYTSKDELGFIANAGVSEIHWKYCIPYNERTMHLLGTEEDYKEGE